MVVADVSPALLRGLAFAFGALWGSFFNVAIYRWPLGMSVVSPPSHCPACGAAVPWYRNLPLVAYLSQRGRAACCGAKMTSRYFFVELLGGVLCLAVLERFVLLSPGDDLAMALIAAVVIFFFTGALLIATFIDLEHTMIPDEVSLPGAALGLVTVALRDMDAAEAAIGAGAGYLLIQLPFVWGYEHLFGRRGMGEGDSKLLLMIGAFVGWQGVVFALLGGCVQGVLVVIGALVLRRDVTAKDEYAFDPGPHAEPSRVEHACGDDGGDATKLLATAVALGANDEPDDDQAGLTLKRVLLTVLLCGGCAVLSLQHIEDAMLAELGAIIAATVGLSVLVLFALAGRRAAAEEAETGGEAEGEDPSGYAAAPPRIPFGPFLALGALEWLFFSDALLALWERFVYVT